MHRLALTKEALMIGRYDPISSHVASPACEKACRNVLLPRVRVRVRVRLGLG